MDDYKDIMFEALVQRLLNSILGEYIENFSAENLKIGIWSGQVILKNVVLKKSIIKKLNLPMIIKYSRLGCLKMNIPWKSLTSSKIEVVLEGFELVVAELPVADWDCKNTKIIEKRKKEVEAFCEAVLNDFGKKAEKAKEKSDDGYLSKLIVKIIDNLQVTIKDIHIRYEDQLTKMYSFGVTLEEFKLYTVNAKGQPQYIDRSRPEYANQPLRKRLELYNIGLYWNQKSQFYSEGNCQSKMGSTIAKRGQNAYNHHYVILMSSQAELLQREAGKQFSEPQINLQIGLDNLKIEITNTQLQQIISIAQRLQTYTRKVKQENRHQLSKDQLKTNREYFKSIFPEYYPGFGKNLPQQDMLKLQEVLEKMEVEHFTSDIKQFLQDKQRQRIIKEKKEKNKGWFWGSPKELTPQELQDIQAYLNDNFGQEVSIVKRPADYYHMKIGFKMQTLEVVIANTLAIIKQGLESRFDDLDISFSLREGGYNLELTLEDISINMFQQKGVDPRQQKAVLYKLNQAKSRDNSYVKMVVIGNPLDKKHLNTEIKVTTSELMVLFDPKIIAIATDFADLNVSKENREAAIEKFGEIKETAGAAVSETMEKPTKAQIGVDVVIRSVTVAVPFSPKKQNEDCWAINLGSLHFTTDEQTLLRTEISDDLPLDVFNMELSAFSFRHYNNVSELQDSLMNNLPYDRTTHAVLNHLDFHLRVQLFSKATQTQPKIKLHTTIPSLQVNLNPFTYKSLLQLGQAFQKQQRVQRSRQTTRIQQKKQIQSKSSKIGFVYIKDSLTKIWKRYIAIMSENYIYLFLNKSDKDYYAYYYIKGAKLDKYTDALDKDKPYHFRIRNSVNQVVFGFNKEEEIEDWRSKIEGLTKEQEMVEQILSTTLSNFGEGVLNLAKEKNHNQLNLWVNAEIQTIGIKVFTTDSQEDKVISLKFQRLASQVQLFESKRKIRLQLFSLELQDTLEYYKSMDLVYFLETKHQAKDQNLINIGIEQLNKDHPQYDQTDSNINVSFGTLSCNYKCQTVKALMGFFIPPPSKQPEEVIAQVQAQDSETTSITTISESAMEFQVYSLKLNLKIQEISVTLVNQKIKTIMGTLGITSLNLYMGISTKRTSLIGSLKDLYYFDTTSYPTTIFQQQQDYSNKRYILTANIGEDKNMLDFNIEILKDLNEYRKNMLIDVKLANLTTYYVQQPVLRLITYLNTQMLPSFDTGPKEAKIVAPKDNKPEPATMDLKVELTNISVFVETQYQPINKDRQEYMQLNIARITVHNQSTYRAYVLGQQKKPIILVENYLVKLYAMSIGVRYFDPKDQQHRYKLTNNLDFTVSTDLIANPDFYKREIPQMFDNGMRLSCEMTSFFMRLNHDDYSFIMKCLNWGVTHNDGLDSVMFDIPAPVVKVQELKPQEKDPFYLTIKMDCISLFVTQDNLPIAFLQLDRMDFSFAATAQTTHMQLKMSRLYGTSIQHNKQQHVLTQRGVFNSLGYSAKHPLQAQPDLDGFIKMFNLREKIQRSEASDFLMFTMVTTQQSTDITIKMNELCIDIDLRLLLLLSNLANTDQNYIKGPNPIKSLQPVIKQEPKGKPQASTKKFALVFSMTKLIGSVCDSSKEKFVFIEGEIYFSMINYGDKTFDDLQRILRESQVKRSISHSSMNAYLKNFTVYFSRVKEGRLLSKREFLQPMVIDFDQKRLYEHDKELHVLATTIRLKTTALLLSASLKDMLNINKILQDNLKVLGESQAKPKQEPKKQEVKRQDLGQQLQKLEERLAREIQTTTKIIGQIAPIQLQVVNDCGNNFMPVLRLIIQETQPAMRQTIISSQLIIVPIINIFFFNPRSSRWQPIIQPFKTTLNYSTITINNQKSVSISIKTDPNGQTSSLKINISTQMMSTIMAATDIVKAEKQKIDRDAEEREIEVSPFVFENITNQRVFVVRRDGEYQLPSLFKGPVRISDDKEIVFKLKDQMHKFSTDHYGVFRIPKSDYLIKFDTQKLNRVVRFLPLLSLKNRLEQTIYVRRSGKVSQVPLQVDKNEWIPLDNVQTFSLSLNGQSYSEVVATKGLKLGSGFVLAEKKNFLVLLRYKDKQGKYAIVDLLPPFVIYNCLPKALNLQFILKAKTKSTVSIPPQQSYSIFTSQDIPSLQIKATAVGYTWSKKFKYRQERDDSQSQLQLGDDSDHHTILNYLFKRNKGSNQFSLTVYCKKIIINEMNDKLLVYGNFQEDEKEKRQERFKLLGGQKRSDDTFDDKVIMIGEEVGNKLRVCGSHSIFDFATPIAIGGLGESQARIVVDREYQGKRDSLFTLVGVEISAIKMAKSCDIFCKKITIKSKSIIINTTTHNMVIKQEFASRYQFTSQAGSKKNFVFGMPDIQGRQYRYSFCSQGYQESRLFVLPTQGTAYFKLVSQADSKEVYFKIYVKEYQSYSFFEISQITSEDFPYQVVVRSSSLKVKVPALGKTVVKGQALRFFKEGEEQQHIVEIVVTHEESKEALTFKVCPDDLKYKVKDLLRVQRGGLIGSIAIMVQVTISDKQRSIVIDEVSRVQQPKQIQQSALSIDISQIILSINQNSQSIEIPFESMVLTLKRLLFIQYQTDRKKQYQLRLGFLQIDQAYPYIISSPVILTPYKYEQFTREKDPKSVFNFTITFSKQFVKNTFIDQISVDFNDIVATFSADFINLATLISNEFGQVINFKETTYFIDKSTEKWQQIVLPPQQNSVYIRAIKISPFIIDLSAQLNIKKLNLQNNLLLTTILSTVGVVMSNIDSAPIQMTGIEIDDCIDTVDSITRQLVTHYKQTCIKQFYKIFGSLNIIGNPLSLFRNISTGVKDLKEKPAKGFVNGPAEFGLGIVEGTGSLLAHSVGGAFNSISKVTGTVSTGLATLAFDKEFQEHREKEKMKKPQNVIQGLEKGGKAIFYGFKEGITGVFTQPFQNAKKEGALGFVKGAAKGLAGLVVKPVTGIIDFASKTTEGIKNNALMFEDKAHEERMRYPRVFYSECFILKEYSQQDSALYSILKKVQNEEKFQNPVFVDSYETQPGKLFLIILTTGVVHLDIESRKVKWSIEYPELQLTDNHNKRLLSFKKKGKSSTFFSNNDFDVPIQSNEMRELIYELIISLQKQQVPQ